MIYLDNNATTPLHPQVAEAMLECWRETWGNPASQHRIGRRAERQLEHARETVAAVLGADVTGGSAERVVFTSGGTEANNLALFGLNVHAPGKVLLSAIEHPSVAAAADELARRGIPVERIRVMRSGLVDVAHLRERLQHSPTRLVSVMFVNHETGVVQPLKEAAAICGLAGVPLHTDAVQAVGKLPVNFRELGVAAMTVAAHKLHGPVGIGALVVRGDVSLTPFHFGGAQQLGARPGTEAVALAVGMRRALELWRDEGEERTARMAMLREWLEDRICDRCPEAVVIGSEARRAPHTACIAFPGLDRQAAAIALDLAGVACSTGSACASGSSEPSPVLLAMQSSEEIVRSALRFSVSAMTTAAEIETAAESIARTVLALRRRNRTGD